MTTYEQEKAKASPRRPRRRAKTTLPADVQAARTKARVRRSALAQHRAKTILTYRYPDEYRELYEAFIAEIDAERGALPGDEA